jgi:ribosomal protein S18 acetylase RimI-like enzyme
MPLVLESSWVGMRVTVRHALDRDDQGRLRLADVVGELLDLDDRRAVIDGRAGIVEVALDRVVAARSAPPSTRDQLDLEAIVARGWRAAETDTVGGWLLRASGGFTGRANSVLPLGQPGMPLPDALVRARAWYAERNLPLRLQLPTEARRLLDASVAEQGWAASPDVHVMVARLDALTGGTADEPPTHPAGNAPAEPVRLSAAPDQGWLARYRDGAGRSADAWGILTRHEHVTFAAIRADPDGPVRAIGRGTVNDGWLGITAVEVDPQLRRAGLAGRILLALAGWGRDQGATRVHVEVSSDNAPAVALYRSRGFRVHHDYRYRTDPGAMAPPAS